jgi:hypothetical protein
MTTSIIIVVALAVGSGAGWIYRGFPPLRWREINAPGRRSPGGTERSPRPCRSVLGERVRSARRIAPPEQNGSPAIAGILDAAQLPESRKPGGN